jgi:hypothetical protein
MKLGHLRASLARFPQDMDDTEILVATHNGKEEELDCLGACGYFDLPTSGAIVLVSAKATEVRIKQGTIKT